MDHEPMEPEDKTEEAGIGNGKKVGLFGCGLFILAALVLIGILVLTGAYVPFEGTDGVGP